MSEINRNRSSLNVHVRLERTVRLLGQLQLKCLKVNKNEV